MSLGFDCSRDRRQQELTKNKNHERKNHVRIMLKDFFGFAEHEGKTTYGLGYKLTLPIKTDNSDLNKDNATVNGKIKNNSIEWYVPRYTPSIPQHAILSKQILSKTPTDLQYVERSVFMKEVNIQNFVTFEIGKQEGINVPIWINVHLQQRSRQDSQNINKDTFYKPPVTSAQGIIGQEKYPDSAILLNYNDDDYSQGYGQIEQAFRALTTDNIPNLIIPDQDFR